MNAEQQRISDKPRLEIDERLGFILAVVAGVLLSIAAGGWMILLSEVTQLKSTVDAGEAQRFAQVGQIEGVIRVMQDEVVTLTGTNGKIRMLEDKIDSTTARFRQIEEALKQGREQIASNNFRLNKVEQEIGKIIGRPNSRIPPGAPKIDERVPAR